jgi:hypothetical protein
VPAPVDPIAAFEADWARIRQSDQTPPRRRRRTQDHNDDRDDYVQAAMSRRELIRLRLDPDVGFVWRGGTIGRYRIDAFSEVGLKTEEPEAHVLRRFVQLAPRVHRGEGGLQTGQDKGRLLRADSKLLALDDPYIELNKVMRGAWRVESDNTWPSWESLRDDLEQLVDNHKLPCLPHAVVAWEDPASGKVYRPHFWFLLPYKSSVWWSNDDIRCNRMIMNLYSGVVRGCTAAIIPIGADPTAIMLPLKGKNPLSPLWESRFWNSHHFPNLSDWAEYVDTRMSTGRLVRAAAARDSHSPASQSNSEFAALQRLAYDELRVLHTAKDPAYVSALGNRALLANLLERACRDRIAHMEGNDRDRKRRFAIFSRVVTYAAVSWRPEKCRPAVDRGACSHLTRGRPLKERQVVAGVYAAQQNRNRCRSLVVTAVAGLLSQRLPVSKAAVARLTGLSWPTVAKWWPAGGAQKI